MIIKDNCQICYCNESTELVIKTRKAHCLTWLDDVDIANSVIKVEKAYAKHIYRLEDLQSAISGL